ncbi:unnamed protein product [Rotaria magnacalcarata]|uniref:RanBP2-type domain-containing protein n=2 Tax=Rotaria magnacalcarata TaxID=392030 RepID=A0A819CCT1_9BILA|nr:unnamed protein product [Rotaria magnacalcarata]CAF3816214.1 unnamed protein product [Rotaria magnacalcarata]
MGQKQAAASSWTIDDLAFGTGQNAVQIEEVIDVVQKIPGKMFGGKVIENDATISRMQTDLLSFDDTLRRIFRRKKKKHSKRDEPPQESYQDEQSHPESEEYYKTDGQYYAQYEEYYDQDGQYYAENQEYYDRNQQAIPEEDETQLSPVYSENNPKTINKDADTDKNLPWRCRYCTAENKSTDIDCRQCKQSESTF